MRASKLNWTIVRPGGLSADSPDKVGNLVVGKEDSFLAKDGDPGREISRQTVRWLRHYCVKLQQSQTCCSRMCTFVGSTRWQLHDASLT